MSEILATRPKNVRSNDGNVVLLGDVKDSRANFRVCDEILASGRDVKEGEGNRLGLVVPVGGAKRADRHSREKTCVKTNKGNA
jgi:hypothetical protein